MVFPLSQLPYNKAPEQPSGAARWPARRDGGGVGKLPGGECVRASDGVNPASDKQMLHHFHLSECVIVHTLHCHCCNLADSVIQSECNSRTSSDHRIAEDYRERKAKGARVSVLVHLQSL